MKAIELDILSGKLKEDGGSSPAAALGTAAHQLGELCLTKNRKPSSYFGKTVDKHKVDEDMVEAVTVYVDYVNNKKVEFKDPIILIEKRKSLQKVVGVQCGGTSDTSVIAVVESTLQVIDYKHGSGVLVEVIDNSQLRIYGLSIYHNLPKAIKRKIKTIILTIAQPRMYHESGSVRSETLSVKKLLAWQKSVLEPAIAETKSSKIILRASESACAWCPRRGYCAEAAAFEMELLELEFSDFAEDAALPPPAELSHDRMLQIILHKDRVIKWLNKVSMYAHELQTVRPTFKGFKLVESMSNRRFDDNKAVIKYLAKLGIESVDMYEERVLKSPSKLESVVKIRLEVKAKEAKEIIDKVSVRMITGTRMVLESSSGKALASEAENDFKSHAKPKKPKKPFKLKQRK
jgi:hypothetical protein